MGWDMTITNVSCDKCKKAVLDKYGMPKVFHSVKELRKWYAFHTGWKIIINTDQDGNQQVDILCDICRLVHDFGGKRK